MLKDTDGEIAVFEGRWLEEGDIFLKEQNYRPITSPEIATEGNR